MYEMLIHILGFNFRICPRTIRDIPIQPVIAIASVIDQIPDPIMITIKITMIKYGIPLIISIIRCIILSTLPPRMLKYLRMQPQLLSQLLLLKERYIMIRVYLPMFLSISHAKIICTKPEVLFNITFFILVNTILICTVKW